MDYKKRRSSLRKALADVGQSDTRNIKRRSISFSGKNSVRVFHGEEEPKTWNNSYEILDHANNKSTMSSTRDLINVSYQHENSKIYQIGHSVDITLHEREITFQGAQVQRINQSITDLFSIPLEDHEKEVRTTLPGEETIDYMSHLKNTSNLIDNDVNNQKDNDPLHELAYKRPTAQIYYRKLLVATHIDATWDIVRWKVKHLKTNYNKAESWRNSTGAGLLETDEGLSSVRDKLKKMCRFYEELHSIFGRKSSEFPFQTFDSNITINSAVISEVENGSSFDICDNLKDSCIPEEVVVYDKTPSSSSSQPNLSPAAASSPGTQPVQIGICFKGEKIY